MYCQKCGNKIEHVNKKCSECGYVTWSCKQTVRKKKLLLILGIIIIVSSIIFLIKNINSESVNKKIYYKSFKGETDIYAEENYYISHSENIYTNFNAISNFIKSHPKQTKVWNEELEIYEYIILESDEAYEKFSQEYNEKYKNLENTHGYILVTEELKEYLISIYEEYKNNEDGEWLELCYYRIIEN